MRSMQCNLVQLITFGCCCICSAAWLCLKGCLGDFLYRMVAAGPPPKLRIHASSVLARTRPQWLVFWQMQQSSSGWFEMQEVTAVEPHWLPELAAHVYSHKGIRS